MSLDPLHISLKGTQLIEASAGTGKTHTIASLYLRLVLGLHGATPRRVSEILVVTFTRAATEELRGRVRSRLFEALDVLERVRTGDRDWLQAKSQQGGALDEATREMLVVIDQDNRVDEAITRLRLELATIDDAAIYTIHGFCQRALQEQAFDSGETFELELVQNDRRRELQAVQDHWRARYYGDGMLAGVARARFRTPEALYGLVKPLLQPGLTLELERVSKDELLALKAGLADDWRREGEALQQAIDDYGALSRGPYKSDAVALAAAALDVWFDDDALLLPAAAALFLRNSLDEYIKPKPKERGERFPPHPLVDALSAYAGACEALAQVMLADVADDVRARLERTRRDSGVAGFDDLILRLHSALTAPSGQRLANALAKRYPVALIDEFQDTDPLQYGVFSAIYGPAKGDEGLLLIGDPKQAIYSFRGADVFAYMDARQHTDARHRHSIDTNRRSVRPLVEALNELFGRHPAPFLYAADIAYQRVAAAGKADADRLVENGEHPVPLEFWLLPDGERGPLSKEKAARATLPRVARRIAELLARGQRGGKPLAPRDVAVLVRTNAQGADVQHALREVGIGSAMAGSDSVFASDEARALRTVLGAIVEPASDRALRRALVSPIWPHDAAFVAALGDDLATGERLLQDLQDWRATWLTRGFMPMFRRFINAGGVAAVMLSLPDGERRMTNLVQLAELLQQASREHSSPEALLRWLDDNIAEPDGNADDQQLRLESDEDLVQVLTLHRSKGLQYPVVFLPFLYATREIDATTDLPRYHDDEKRLVVDLSGKAESFVRAEYERLAEDMRLVYVALTRAKDYCVVPWGRINKTDRSALAYLLHGPRGLTRVDELAAKMQRLSHADIRAELGGLAAAHDTWFRVVDIDAVAAGDVMRATRAVGTNVSLAARTSVRVARQRWATTSFSRLVGDASDEVRDVGSRHEARAVPSATKTDATLTPFALPSSADIGTMFHDILEEIDYAPPLAEAVSQVVSRHLARHGRPQAWREVVTSIVDQTLDAEIADGFTLRSLTRDRRRNEIQFWYPVSQVRPEALEIQLPGLGAGVVSRRLNFQPVQGYLEGFIDLVFEHEGRWHVLDWKTNLLGPDASFFTREHLARAIAGSRYDLQYALYTLALHRHLRRALGPRYDPKRHLGDVYYLFLRGLRAGDPARPGVWHVPADVERVEALDALLRGEDAK